MVKKTQTKKSSAKTKPLKKGPAKKRDVKKSFPWWKLFFSLSVLSIVVLVFLDAQVRYGLNERQWQSPARVYSRALVIQEGQYLVQADFKYELKLLGYQLSNDARQPGSYWQQGALFKVATRGNKQKKSVRFQFQISEGKVTALRSAWGSKIEQVSLEPVQIGSIYPSHKEDRLLVQLEDVPLSLREILLLVEDREFYSHWGLSPKAIARALVANIKAGRTVQGGSTITQQLVKNVFLTRSRSLWRKATEAVMTLLVELHYSKDQILESYINEIYLGQEGPRAIHGFALASQHYFNQPLYELDPGQIALLVGMVKGPSYYDPWRHPERAEARRDVVLKLMAQHELITAEQSEFYQMNRLGLAKDSAIDAVFPAYLDLVRRQLRRDYSEQELQTQGMKIYTAFDPIVQRHAEQSLSKVTQRLEKPIQGAVVVNDVNTGDIVALVGGRQMRYAGFNRAIDAVRPIGSLIKPAVYLTALEKTQRYTLATTLSDAPVEVKGADGSLWQPRNFDRKNHGDVLLHKALAKSYNQATARLGMTLGLGNVVNMVERLGVNRALPEVPALLLGAGAMSPLDVTQMYQTIASHGVSRPLRTITEINNQQGKLLARYPVRSREVVDKTIMHLLHYSMMEVVREGTGSAVYQTIRDDFAVAGKTGTTNDLRDSWFAGFAGDYLAVVWMGRDDNQPAKLTGASGALKVWRELFANISHQPIDLEAPPGVVYQWIDSEKGLLSKSICEKSRFVPFVQGSAPTEKASCNTSVNSVLQWFRELF